MSRRSWNFGDGLVISGCGHAESALAAEAQLTAAPQRGEGGGNRPRYSWRGSREQQCRRGRERQSVLYKVNCKIAFIVERSA
jgi:hypothetical protein